MKPGMIFVCNIVKLTNHKQRRFTMNNSLTKYFSRDIPLVPSLFSLFDDGDFFTRRPLELFKHTDDIKVDIVDHDDKVAVTAITPGFSKGNIKIEYDKGYLTVSGDIKKEETKEEKKYLYREIGSNSFARRFYLGDSFDKANIDASFKDGILTITLPKKEEEKFKEIEIK